MNTNTITKFFTLVSIFVVSAFTTTTYASPTTTVSAPSGETREQCIARKTADKEAACDGITPATEKEACISGAARSAARDPECLAKDSREDAKENDGACEDAFKQFKDGLADSLSACEGLVGKSADSKQRCSQKIQECKEMAAQTSSQTPQSDNGIGSTINIFRAVIGGEDSLGTSSAGSCLIDIDSKEARDAEKEFRDRRKELQDEKKKIEDDAIKDKEDNDKEITRITKEIQELQRENKKTLAEADVRMREQLNQSQKDMVDSAARLRNLTTQISKKNDSLRALNFAYADRMLDTSAQKANLRCKQVLDTAKTCMIKSAKNIQDPACKDFPFTIKSKGPKATAELKAQLQVVNDACYEKEDRERKKLQFDQQEQQKKVADEMTELQAQAKEEGQRQQIQSENSTKISQEAEREKQEAQANMAEQIATLQGEMAQFAQRLEAKNYRSQERLAKLTEDLQKLELEEKTGKRSKTSLASAAVRKSNANFEEVIGTCDCNPKLAEAKDDNVGGTSNKTRRICASTKRLIPSASSGSTRKRGGSTSSGGAL